jgi:tRNA threonylcarbamoyladenosine biosynthesis protein TsaB
VKRLLAIETSGSVCGAAVSIDGRLVTTTEIIRPNAHDEHLVGCVETVIANADLRVEDIDVVALSAGPGSFTGLRIGASFAKGWCFDSNCLFLPVPTLTALHHAAREVAVLAGRSFIAAVVASHRDLYYVASTPVDHPAGIAPVHLVGADDVRTLCTPETLVVGPAAETFTTAPVSGLTRLSARFVAHAAWALLAAGVSTVDAASFVPAYEQDFVPRS